MSYYGASGSKHVYVATDQPLYGLGSEPGAPQGKRIQTVTNSPELMAALPAIETSKVSWLMSATKKRVCPGLVLAPFNRHNVDPIKDSVPAVQAFESWKSLGLFVVIFRIPSDYAGAGCMFEDGVWDTNVNPVATAWRAEAVVPNDIGKMLGRSDAYVWGMPYGKNDWAPYKQYIDAENPTVGSSWQPPQFPPFQFPPFQFPPIPGTTPPVTSTPPVVTPPASESGISLVHVGLGALAIFLAWKLLKGGEGASYEANVDEFEENCWE